VTSTPSKDSARSTPSKSGASKYEAEEETYISSGGSGRRRLRKIERSKLGLESVLRGEENGDNEEDEEELTPGRREALARFMDKGKGKAKLAREIDRIWGSFLLHWFFMLLTCSHLYQIPFLDDSGAYLYKFWVVWWPFMRERPQKYYVNPCHHNVAKWTA